MSVSIPTMASLRISVHPRVRAAAPRRGGVAPSPRRGAIEPQVRGPPVPPLAI